MKTAQLPPVRVDPPVRAEIEAALREGESLSEFVKTAALEAARRRKAQDAFLARGRAALAQAQHSGEWHDADAVLDAMRDRLAQRLEGLGQGGQTGGDQTP
jgi:Arc/MetJ-type ribon-helix-helix transcriptional regulator